MKVYLAARFGRRAELIELRRTLQHLGWTVTSTWLDITDDEDFDRAGTAATDIADLLAADIVLSLTEEPNDPIGKRGGRNVEFGLGLMAKKRMAIIGPRENVFHWLPEVDQYPDVHDFLYQMFLEYRASSGA